MSEQYPWLERSEAPEPSRAFDFWSGTGSGSSPASEKTTTSNAAAATPRRPTAAPQEKGQTSTRNADFQGRSNRHQRGTESSSASFSSAGSGVSIARKVGQPLDTMDGEGAAGGASSAAALDSGYQSEGGISIPGSFTRSAGILDVGDLSDEEEGEDLDFDLHDSALEEERALRLHIPTSQPQKYRAEERTTPRPKKMTSMFLGRVDGSEKRKGGYESREEEESEEGEENDDSGLFWDDEFNDRGREEQGHRGVDAPLRAEKERLKLHDQFSHTTKTWSGSARQAAALAAKELPVTDPFDSPRSLPGASLSLSLPGEESPIASFRKGKDPAVSAPYPGVSESWDDDFLFQDDGSVKGESNASKKSKTSLQFTTSDDEGDQDLESWDAQFAREQRQESSLKRPSPERRSPVDSIENWDQDFHNDLQHQTKRTSMVSQASRASSKSNLTDLSARLALQSDVSSLPGSGSDASHRSPSSSTGAHLEPPQNTVNVSKAESGRSRLKSRWLGSPKKSRKQTTRQQSGSETETEAESISPGARHSIGGTEATENDSPSNPMTLASRERRKSKSTSKIAQQLQRVSIDIGQARKSGQYEEETIQEPLDSSKSFWRRSQDGQSNIGSLWSSASNRPNVSRGSSDKSIRRERTRSDSDGASSPPSSPRRRLFGLRTLVSPPISGAPRAQEASLDDDRSSSAEESAYSTIDTALSRASTGKEQKKKKSHGPSLSLSFGFNWAQRSQKDLSSGLTQRLPSAVSSSASISSTIAQVGRPSDRPSTPAQVSSIDDASQSLGFSDERQRTPVRSKAPEQRSNAGSPGVANDAPQLPSRPSRESIRRATPRKRVLSTKGKEKEEMTTSVRRMNSTANSTATNAEGRDASQDSMVGPHRAAPSSWAMYEARSFSSSTNGTTAASATGSSDRRTSGGSMTGNETEATTIYSSGNGSPSSMRLALEGHDSSQLRSPISRKPRSETEAQQLESATPLPPAIDAAKARTTGLTTKTVDAKETNVTTTSLQSEEVRPPVQHPPPTRRNSLGDLKIPSRISKAQDNLKANIGHIRDFAAGVEELKVYRQKYAELLDSLLDREQEEVMRSPIDSTPSAFDDTEMLYALEDRYAAWWECADVLMALGEGRSETDKEASVATLEQSTMARERRITLETPSQARRFSQVGAHRPEQPREVAFDGLDHVLGDGQSTVRRQSGSRTTSSRASSTSRSVNPQRELDILSAMLAGAPPEELSSPLSSTHREPSSRTRASPQPQSRHSSVSTNNIASAPYQVPPVINFSTESIDRPWRDTGRGKLKHTGRSGLNGLMELLRAFKLPSTASNEYANRLADASMSQLSLAPGANAMLDISRPQTSLDDYPSSQHGTGNADGKKRSIFGKSSVGHSPANTDNLSSRQHKHFSWKGFTTTSSNAVPSSWIPSRTRRPSTASTRSSFGESIIDGSIDSDWTQADISHGSSQRRESDEFVASPSPPHDANTVRRRLVSLSEDNPHPQKTGPHLAFGQKRSFSEAAPTQPLPSTSSGALVSTPDRQISIAQAGLPRQPSTRNPLLMAARQQGSTGSPSRPEFNSRSVSESPRLTPSSSQQSGLADLPTFPSPRRTRVVVPPRPSSSRSGFSTSEYQTVSGASIMESSGDSVYSMTTSSTSNTGNAVRAQSPSGESARSVIRVSMATQQAKQKDRRQSTTGKPSSVGASSGAAAAAAATYRKLALQPEAIPSLLSYMHATRNHCRQSIEQLEHINAGRGQSASLPFSKSTIAVGSVLPKSSATDQARGAEPLSLSSSRPPSSFRSPPSAITFDERSKSAAREAHNSVDSQTTIRGNKGIFSSFSAGDSAENMNFGSSVSMKTNTPFPMTSESVVSSPAQPPPLSTSPLAHTGTASSSDSSSLPTANTASPATKASSQPTTQHQRRPSLLPNRFSSSSSSKRRGE